MTTTATNQSEIDSHATLCPFRGKESACCRIQCPFSHQVCRVQWCLWLSLRSHRSLQTATDLHEEQVTFLRRRLQEVCGVSTRPAECLRACRPADRLDGCSPASRLAPPVQKNHLPLSKARDSGHEGEDHEPVLAGLPGVAGIALNRFRRVRSRWTALEPLESGPRAPGVEIQLRRGVQENESSWHNSMSPKNGNYRFCADPPFRNTEITGDFSYCS
jgi:hypothetical protein